MIVIRLIFFFFSSRRRHTRLQGDWSSDVCSSDLKAFGGRLSVAQALAGAQLAVGAKAGIEQRFTRNDVRGTLRTDRERSGVGYEGNGGLPQSSNGGLPQSSHGTSVLAATGRGR